MRVELVKGELEALSKVLALYEELICRLGSGGLEWDESTIPVHTDDGEYLGHIGWGECGPPCFIVGEK